MIFLTNISIGKSLNCATDSFYLAMCCDSLDEIIKPGLGKV